MTVLHDQIYKAKDKISYVVPYFLPFYNIKYTGKLKYYKNTGLAQ